eukprot:1142063-Pelagomonas_calceolata.AAC.4
MCTNSRCAQAVGVHRHLVCAGMSVKHRHEVMHRHLVCAGSADVDHFRTTQPLPCTSPPKSLTKFGSTWAPMDSCSSGGAASHGASQHPPNPIPIW